LSKYKPRDIRKRDGYIQAELQSEEMVQRAKLEIPSIYTKQEWFESQQEVHRIREEAKKVCMMDQTTEMMKDDDSNFVRVTFLRP
jgi:hypothetical protein